jgi:hypothetical protein
MEAFVLLIACFIFILICPFIDFALGYIIGLIIKITFGGTFIAGLKLLGINISADSIPLLCGTLSLVGSFFKSTNPNNKNQKLEKELNDYLEKK